MDIDDIELFIVNNRKDGAMIERLSFALGFSKDVNTQAEPERKGLEECAREIRKIFVAAGEYDWLQQQKSDGMVIEILRTLAPECHIEAAVEEIFNEYIDEKDPAPEQISSVKTSIAKILRKHLREAPDPSEAGEAALREKWQEIQALEEKQSDILGEWCDGSGKYGDPPMKEMNEKYEPKYKEADEARKKAWGEFRALLSTPSPGAPIVEALEEIANHDKTSDYEWYDSWGDMKGVDISNNGDVHSHGFSMGTHSCAKIARKALGRE